MLVFSFFLKKILTTFFRPHFDDCLCYDTSFNFLKLIFELKQNVSETESN